MERFDQLQHGITFDNEIEHIILRTLLGTVEPDLRILKSQQLVVGKDRQHKLNVNDMLEQLSQRKESENKGCLSLSLLALVLAPVHTVRAKPNNW